MVDEEHLGNDWLNDACLHLLSGDEDGYRKLCALLTARYGATRNSDDAWWMGLILSQGPNAADPAQAVRWEEQSVAAAPTMAWRLHGLALAHYRAGQVDAAERYYRASIKQDEAENDVEPADQAGLALVKQRRKHPDEARQCLDKAAAWIQQANADRPKEEAESMPRTMQLSDWLEYLLLKREAEGS